MLSSLEIERRISAFRAIEDIVGAMKAYAGIVIRKTEELVINLREYEESISQAMARIVAHHGEIAQKMEYPGPGRRILVACGSSQGLCGLFNERMADAVSGELQDGDALFVTGRKLRESLASRQIVPQYYAGSASSVSGIQGAIEEAISRLIEIYGGREFYRLAFIFMSVSGQKPQVLTERVLPPDMDKFLSALPPGKTEKKKNPPLLNMGPDRVFEKLIEQLIFAVLYRSHAESLRSENWYRLQSMEGAAENLRKRISGAEALQRYVRQEEITEEVLEVLQGQKN